MSKILNVYRNNLDKAWFNSSNIKFSECQDNEGELKTLDVVFNNGSRYRYKGVDVNDYLMFREAASQGKALNQYIKSKGYEYEKLPNADIGLIEEELNDRSLQTYIIDNSDRFTIYDYLGNIVYENTKLSEEEYSNIANILKSVNANFKAKKEIRWELL